jgi:hypothetical protein
MSVRVRSTLYTHREVRSMAAIMDAHVSIEEDIRSFSYYKTSTYTELITLIALTATWRFLRDDRAI